MANVFRSLSVFFAGRVPRRRRAVTKKRKMRRRVAKRKKRKTTHEINGVASLLY